MGYKSKKMHNVHLWGDWVSSKSQNSQPFSQKLHLKVFSLCHVKKMRKNFLHKKFLITRKFPSSQFYISCFIKIFVSPIKKQGIQKTDLCVDFTPLPGDSRIYKLFLKFLLILLKIWMHKLLECLKILHIGPIIHLV